VPPQITSVTGPPKVPLLNQGTSGPNYIELQAAVSPSDGSFSWSSTSNKISLENASSATVRVISVTESGARGDIPIDLTYSIQGQPPAKWHGTLTVVKPASLGAAFNEVTNPSGHTCNPNASQDTCDTSKFTGSGTYTSFKRTLNQKIMDHLQPSQWIEGFSLTLEESYSTPTGCTQGSINTGGGNGDTITDCFYFCAEPCRTQGSCQVSATQTIKANGYVVATKSVTWSCGGVTIK
jgi:hypothetical protein